MAENGRILRERALSKADFSHFNTYRMIISISVILLYH